MYSYWNKEESIQRYWNSSRIFESHGANTEKELGKGKKAKSLK